VIRFGGRFVQPTKRGLCPVAEKANFQKSESDQPVARFDGENFRLGSQNVETRNRMLRVVLG
jgi:hypothetical protein